MGFCKVVKRLVLYGGITIAGLYLMAGCEKRPAGKPPSDLEKMADQGLKVVQDGIGASRKGLDWLEQRVKEGREYLNPKQEEHDD